MGGENKFQWADYSKEETYIAGFTLPDDGGGFILTYTYKIDYDNGRPIVKNEKLQIDYDRNGTWPYGKKGKPRVHALFKKKEDNGVVAKALAFENGKIISPEHKAGNLTINAEELDDLVLNALRNVPRKEVKQALKKYIQGY